jgi:hypothetical protein
MAATASAMADRLRAGGENSKLAQTTTNRFSSRIIRVTTVRTTW